MDPLSVTASIVGILAAAAQVSSVLSTFVRNTKAAPKLAQAVLVEVNGLSAVLSQLQTYLLGTASSSKSRASLILVEQVIVTLTECVTTFSELEDVLGTGRAENDFGILDRVKWAMRDSKVSDIQRRLYSNKTSLTLMLTILQCKSMEEAESAMVRLCNLVEQVLAKNEEMSLRLRNIDDAVAKQQSQSKKSTGNGEESVLSERTVTPPPGPSNDRPERAQPKGANFTFEEDLLASRVYRKPLFSKSGESLVTSAARTTATSVLSALSLTDISNISVLAVPIYAHEISNSTHYTFGDLHPPAMTAEIQRTPVKHVDWRRRLKNAIKPELLPIMDFSPKSEFSQTRIKAILGLPLHESIKHANVAIYMLNEKAEIYTGCIPIIVGKIGIFLKETGQSRCNHKLHDLSLRAYTARDVVHIFAISGSPVRLQQLENIFNNPPGYGRGHDWTGYTIHDAANILLRFLLLLPESVIPIEHYEAFQVPLETIRKEPKSAIATFQHLIKLMPSSARHLLIYLLDLLAAFASKSDVNKMTVSRLAAIFQPAILSPVKARDDDFIEEAASRQHSQVVVAFLIAKHDHFLFG